MTRHGRERTLGIRMRTITRWWAVATCLASATANADEASAGPDEVSTKTDEAPPKANDAPASADVTPAKADEAPASADETAAKPEAKPTTDDASANSSTPSAKPADSRPPTGKVGIVPFALIGYTPEMGVLVGAATVGVYRYAADSGRRDSQVMLAGAVSLKKQVTLVVKPDIYLFDDSLQLSGTVGVSRAPNQFYGIGSHTRAEDKERYTPFTFELALSPKFRLFRGMYVGPDARFTNTNMEETEAGGMLAQGTIPGSRGGRTVEVGISAFYDTRNETIYPLNGHIVRVFARMALPALGSDFDYDVLSVDARKYISLPWGQRHVLALQALAEIRDGAPPFYELGLMGGDQMMRGYFKGRFRDRNYLAAQVEYRLPLFWRFGAVAFASAGQTSHTLSDARFSPLRLAAGGGLRFAPLADVPVNLRLDVAYGNEALFYIGLAEAF